MDSTVFISYTCVEVTA